MKDKFKESSRLVFRHARRKSFEWVYPRWPSLHNALFFEARRKAIRILSLIRRRSWLWMPEVFSREESTATTWQPLVSVIVPCFNHANYLKERLESIAGQTYKNIEIILLDDASSDGSDQILRLFHEKHADISQLIINQENGGKPFAQWSKGLDLAKGELIWIAESDDFCTPDFLAELVPLFRNRGVMLAMGRTHFVSEDGQTIVWSLEEYLPEFGQKFWKQPFIETTHQLIQHSWAARNLVPNASGCVFRKPARLGIRDEAWWCELRVCGDWLFYLDLVRGGLVAYQPTAKNFYRQHSSNSSVSQHKQKIYFHEHNRVAQWIRCHFTLERSALEAMNYALKKRWQMCSSSSMPDEHNQESTADTQSKQVANLLIVTYALVAGGGEIFPIRLANGLREKGHNVTILNCNQRPTQLEVLRMINSNIPVLTLNRLQDLGQIIRHFSINLIHTHHAWVDTTISELLADFPSVKHVITSHGMYDYMDDNELKRIGRILRESVGHATYVSVSNKQALRKLGFEEREMTHISNAMETKAVDEPFDRENIGIAPNSFVICLVSRAIKEKGWEEAIQAVTLLRQQHNIMVDLLLVGDGPIRLPLEERFGHLEYIHFLGFRSDTCSLFAGSDVGLLPSYFMGESQPLTLIECLQSGSPYIASSLGDIPAMLESEHGLAGSLIPIKNKHCSPNDITASIKHVIDNWDISHQYKEQVKQAAKKFSWNVMVERYSLVYGNVMTQH